MQYLDYLNTARELDKQKEAEIERLVLEDQQQQNDKWLRREKLNAAARRRLFCDVRAVQQQQRQEKGKTCRFSIIPSVSLRQLHFDRLGLATGPLAPSKFFDVCVTEKNSIIAVTPLVVMKRSE